MTYSVEQEYFHFPWWYYKSKVKHFALGLLDSGMQSGDFVYILAKNNPNRSYAILASVCLKTPFLLLESPDESYLDGLIKKYPPKLVLWDNESKSFYSSHFDHGKQTCISLEDFENYDTGNDFRKVFNLGVYAEKKRITDFDKIVLSINPEDRISPLFRSSKGIISDSGLFHKDVEVACQSLTQLIPLQSQEIFLIDEDMSGSFFLVIALFWPIMTGIDTVFKNSKNDFFKRSKNARPTMIFLNSRQIQELNDYCLEKKRFFFARRSNKIWSKFIFFWKNFQLRKSFQHFLGGKLRRIISFHECPEPLSELCKLSKVTWIQIDQNKILPQ